MPFGPLPVELTNPLGLTVLGLLAPLIALYVLRVQREPRQVGSTWLWRAAERDLLARKPWRRLTPFVSLLLEALALIALALALSGPALRSEAIAGDTVAFIIDGSASMGTLEADGRTRLALAKERAKKLIGSLAPGSRAMLLEAGREPHVRAPLDRDFTKLEAALAALEPRDEEGALARSVALAADKLRQLEGERRIVLLTDRAVADADKLTPPAVPVDVVEIGEPHDNTALIRLDVRSGRDAATGRDQVQVFAVVAHHGSAPRELFVTLRQKDVVEPLASRKLRITPGERAPVQLTFEQLAGDAGSGLLVELSPGDALPADDRAYTLVPPSRKLPVVIAPKEGAAWLRRALSADPDVELLGAQLEALGAAGVPADALVVVDGACPPAIPGGAFVIASPPAGACRGLTVGAPATDLTVTSWEPTDARLRFLALDGITVSKARLLTGASPRGALVRAREGVLVADASAAGRVGTVIGFDVGESNWPLRASFVLFVRNLVEQARAQRARGVGAGKSGETVRARVPLDVSEVKIESADKRRSTAIARSGLALLPELPRAGFHVLSWQGATPGTALLATSLLSAAESDPKPRELPFGSRGGTGGGVRTTNARTDWSFVLALIALAAVVADVRWLGRNPRRRGLDRLKPVLPERVRRGAA